MRITGWPLSPAFLAAEDGLSLLTCAVLVGMAGVLYVTPAVIASWRKHRNANAIGALTLLLGWTVIGWVVAFVWALTDDR